MICKREHTSSGWEHSGSIQLRFEYHPDFNRRLWSYTISVLSLEVVDYTTGKELHLSSLNQSKGILFC